MLGDGLQGAAADCNSAFSIDISAIIANWQTGPLWDSILFSDFRLALADWTLVCSQGDQPEWWYPWDYSFNEL